MIPKLLTETVLFIYTQLTFYASYIPEPKADIAYTQLSWKSLVAKKKKGAVSLKLQGLD